MVSKYNRFRAVTAQAVITCCSLTIFWGLVLAGCTEEQSKPVWQQRRIPVHVLQADASRLTHQARITGSVTPWKSEDVKFQIAGRLAELKILTPGTMVKGEVQDEAKRLLYKGDVIAVLDETPYQLAVKDATAQLEVAKIRLTAATQAKAVALEATKAAQARIDASLAEINDIIPLNVKTAQDQYSLAQSEYKLVKEAYERKDTTDSRIATARTAMLIAETEAKKASLQKGFKEKELQTYKAELVKAQVEEKLRDAEEKISEAQVKQADAALARATNDLHKCVLYAPFSGVVARIFINPGSMVDQTVPVVQLVMMDPVKVEMAVSFKKIRDFYFGNEVKVYPLREQAKPERGYVYHIQTTADPATRTFLAIVTARNQELDLDPTLGYKDYSDYPQIRDFGGVVHKNPDGSGPMYIDVRSLQKDAQGTFVWKLVKDPAQRLSPEAVVQKVYVQLSEQDSDNYANVVTWLFRKLKDAGGLKEEDILLATPPANLQENQKVVQVRKDWLFHPGELVEVEYERELAEGLYLPPEAILESDDKMSYFVFVVEDVKKAPNGEETGFAKFRKVVRRPMEDLWKIETGIKAGDQVVIYGRDAVKTRYETVCSPSDETKHDPIPVQIMKRNDLSELVKGYNVISGK